MTALAFLAKFAEFYYHKIFEEVDGDLSVFVDECNPCCLSITADNPQWRKALWTSIKELFLLAKFDNISPSITRNKDICHMIMR